MHRSLVKRWNKCHLLWINSYFLIRWINLYRTTHVKYEEKQATGHVWDNRTRKFGGAMGKNEKLVSRWLNYFLFLNKRGSLNFLWNFLCKQPQHDWETGTHITTMAFKVCMYDNVEDGFCLWKKPIQHWHPGRDVDPKGLFLQLEGQWAPYQVE